MKTLTELIVMQETAAVGQIAVTLAIDELNKRLAPRNINMEQIVETARLKAKHEIY